MGTPAFSVPTLRALAGAHEVVAVALADELGQLGVTVCEQVTDVVDLLGKL